jgi:hypothetical protein
MQRVPTAQPPHGSPPESALPPAPADPPALLEPPVFAEPPLADEPPELEPSLLPVPALGAPAPPPSPSSPSQAAITAIKSASVAGKIWAVRAITLIVPFQVTRQPCDAEVRRHRRASQLKAKRRSTLCSGRCSCTRHRLPRHCFLPNPLNHRFPNPTRQRFRRCHSSCRSYRGCRQR